MAINQVQLTSLRLLKSASAGSVDGAIHGALRNRSEVPESVVPLALAEGLSVSSVCWPDVVAVPSRGPDLLSMSGMPAPDDAAQRYVVRSDQAAADNVVSGDPHADFDQVQHGSA
jgi:hypothetical protein